MNKHKNSKNKTDITEYKHKKTFDFKSNNTNNCPMNADDKNTIDINLQNKQNKILDNDFTDLTNIVRNSVEKINNLFNLTEFQTKKYFQKESKTKKMEQNEIDEEEELNKSDEVEKKDKINKLRKSSKTNFTFNINNFINVPNITNSTIPNANQEEKNNLENKEISLRSSVINKNSKKNIYLNLINDKKNLLIEHKRITNKKLNGLCENHNNSNYLNYNTLNEYLSQIDEIQKNNSNKNTNNNNNTNNTNDNLNFKKINPKTNNVHGKSKNLKNSIINSRGNRVIDNTFIKSDLPKLTKDLRDYRVNTPAYNENMMTLPGPITINQNKKVIYRLQKNKRKEYTTLNNTNKIKDYNGTMNQINKYKMKQIENKNIIKRNNYDLNLNKTKGLKNSCKLSQSKKFFRTIENFYSTKQESNKNSNLIDININEPSTVEDTSKNIINNNKTLQIQNDDNTKNKNKSVRSNKNILFKTKNEINANQNLYNTNLIQNTELSNAINNLKNNIRRGGSINYERRKLGKKKENEAIYQSSKIIFNQVINSFYEKAFPSDINTNEILKLILFLNEYLINNNLLSDCNKNGNKKILDDYSKFISSNIKDVYLPSQESDGVINNTIKCTKIIQRKWRKYKVGKYLKKNKKSEKNELKKMVMNKYIKKSGYKMQKILGLFNTIIENFDNISQQPDNKQFYNQLQKIMQNRLTNYEKNMLYKEFINNVILNNKK